MKKCNGNYRTNYFKGCGNNFNTLKYGLCVRCLYNWSTTTKEGKEWYKKNSIKNKYKDSKKKYKKISPISKKRELQNKKYLILREEFLSIPENKICPIYKTPTTDIHHMKGRIGDLLLNINYWVALSREGHRYVEDHPKWALENGYTVKRNQ